MMKRNCFVWWGVQKRREELGGEMEAKRKGGSTGVRRRTIGTWGGKSGQSVEVKFAPMQMFNRGDSFQLLVEMA